LTRPDERSFRRLVVQQAANDPDEPIAVLAALWLNMATWSMMKLQQIQFYGNYHCFLVNR
jgi:hypothetical protein